MAVADLLLTILINLIWGLNFIAIKFAVADFPPLLSNTLRFTCVFILMIPFLKVIKGQMVHVLRLAFLMGVMHFGLVAVAMATSDGISAIAIAGQLNVPFSTLFAIIMLKETVGWRRVLGITLSFAGVLLLGFDPAVFDYVDGVLMVGLAAAFIALASIYMRRLQAVGAMTIQSWVSLMAVLGCGALSLGLEDDHFSALSGAGYQAWGGIVYSAIFASIIGHGGLNYLLKKYEVTVVSPYMLLMPLFAVIFGVIFIEEAITTRMLLGGGITLVGVLIITLRNTKKTKDPILPQEET